MCDRDSLFLGDADVVVVGGGPGGLGAAVMAARAGARTMLVERYGQLGGMAVSGEVHPFMLNHANGRSLDGPVYTEWVARMRHYLPAGSPNARLRSPECLDGSDRAIDKNLAMLAAEDLCLEAGVVLRYHHTLVGARCRERHVESVHVHSKSGFGTFKGRVFIDATGDGDLAAACGCRTACGGPSGACQPMTLCFKLSCIDRARIPSREAINRAYREACARGEIDCPRENVLSFKWMQPDVLHFNTTRIIKHSGVDGIALSDAEIEGRRQLRQFLTFFRRAIPGFEQARLFSVAHHVGVRETRRVIGRQMLTRDAFFSRFKCPDAIARVAYAIDIHNPDGSGTEMETMPPGDWYEIPYGCIVAADSDNLLIAGRPISVDHALHSSMRVMPSSCSIGQAAGMAAALAVKQACIPADLDGKAVRLALRAAGARL